MIQQDLKDKVIAVDLDGTLAEYHGERDNTFIGKPIPAMVGKVRAASERGATIYIFTSRLAQPIMNDEQMDLIPNWLDSNYIPYEKVTGVKLQEIDEFWDDRAVGVVKNTGIFNKSSHSLLDVPVEIGTTVEVSGTGTVGVTDSAFGTQIGGRHYKGMAIEPAEFCHKNNIGPLESAVIKYMCRHKNKNKDEDLRKAMHCIQLLRELEYGYAKPKANNKQRELL